MSNIHEASEPRIQLRKYPNRRYYDATRSQHVTLEEIHRLILDGRDVQVTDSKSGADITAKVLTQIILEHDPPKLAVLPVELLHQVIRANEPLIRDFIDKYFSRALMAFFESRRQFERYLRESLRLAPSVPGAAVWPPLLLGPFAQSFFADGGQRPADQQQPEPDSAASPGDLRAEVEALRKQIEALRQSLGHP